MQHQDGVADRDRERTTRTAFTNDDADHRHTQGGQLEQVAANCLRLAALLSTHAGVGTRRVDEGDNGEAELLCGLHQAQGLPIPLGAGHAEVAVDLVAGVPTLLVAYNQHGLAIKPGKATDDRRIVGKRAITVQLVPVGE